MGVGRRDQADVVVNRYMLLDHKRLRRSLPPLEPALYGPAVQTPAPEPRALALEPPPRERLVTANPSDVQGDQAARIANADGEARQAGQRATSVAQCAATGAATGGSIPVADMRTSELLRSLATAGVEQRLLDTALDAGSGEEVRLALQMLTGTAPSSIAETRRLGGSLLFPILAVVAFAVLFEWFRWFG